MRVWDVPFKLNVNLGGPTRSPGVHLSEVIRDLALRGGILDKKFANDDIEDHPERIALGLAWEEWVSKQHPEICFHPGEVMVDGISMSVDGVSVGSDELSIFGQEGTALHEIKLTWKSARKPIDEQWMWITQVKGYLHGLSFMQKTKVRRAYLHPFYVNGNYSRSPGDPLGGPKYMIYGMEFSDLEIAENWSMLTSHRDRMFGSGKKISMRRK